MKNKPAQVKSLLQKKSYSTSAISITWKKVGGATGYEVYRGDSLYGDYKKIKTTTKNSYKNSKLKVGNKYYYKIRAYKTVNGKNYYGDYSEPVLMKTKVTKPTFKLSASKKQVKIKWNKVNGTVGYEIYMSNSKKGKYTKINNAAANSVSFTKKKLKSGKRYYFKMKAYTKINNTKVYSSFSKIKSIKVK